MSADTIRLAFAYSIALVVVAAGMVQIYVLLDKGIISGDAGLAILGPLIGAAVTFVWQREATTQGSRASERAVAQGANAGVTPEPAKQ